MTIIHLSIVILLLQASSPSSFTHGSRRFDQDVDITWGDGRGKFLDDGQLLTLSMDNYSGSGFQSKNQYLFSKLDMDMKLIGGDSAATVTTFYLSSQGSNHDEIDFEFIGNLSGDPYVLNTNLFAQGKGRREQQFFLWFDPTADFHTYTILWNQENVIWYIDGMPIRVFKNYEEEGVQFPSSQPMSMYASLWEGGDWATRGGKIKIDWSQAPFTASYENFYAEACVWSSDSGSTCDSTAPGSWFHQELDSEEESKLEWAQQNYMVYNYCTDVKRFPQGLPPECSISLRALRNYI